MNSAPLLQVDGLSVEFDSPQGGVRVVDDLSFEVQAGQTLAIVGESGSGKSVTAMCLTRLLDHTAGRICSGTIRYQSRKMGAIDLRTLPAAALSQVRGSDISMIFQEPMTSLNPVYTVGNQVVESLCLHQNLTQAQALRETIDLFEKVRMPDARELVNRYPHQLSGGMRQRVMIAMAVACRPQLLIADEPTTALDVTIQAQILNIIRELQCESGTSVIFITHDMGVVAEMAQDVVVMRRGRRVEQGPVNQILREPKHPYTQALLASVPRLGALAGQDLPRREPLIMLDEHDNLQRIGLSQVQDTVQHEAHPLLEVKDLTVRFDVERNLLGRVQSRVHAVEGVSLSISPGETLALVGESGSGKSTIGKCIQRLLSPTAGQIRFSDQSVLDARGQDSQRLRQKIQYVFQDPYASLNPRKTVGFSIAEPIRTHRLLSDENSIQKRVAQLLDQVGLPATAARRYPHEFSGGQRQRVCIARALASNPELIIADESVSALDVSIQAQVVDLFMRLQSELKLAYLFITHDMAIVEKISHRVAVLYLGRIVETGRRRDVFEHSAHPYTQKLLSAVPVLEPGRQPDAALLDGDIPSVIHPASYVPPMHSMLEVRPGHWVAMH